MLDCSLRPHTADVDMADCNSQLSATQEACQAELQEIESMCGTSGQAEAAPAGQQVGRSLQEEDWHEVLYKVNMGQWYTSISTRPMGHYFCVPLAGTAPSVSLSALW